MKYNKKWTIDKSFSFCYGHRVHNQRLDTNFTESGDACLACRYIHGHEGLFKVFLSGDSNNVAQTGMITDFKHLGWFKNFLDDVLDHKFIMDLEDPIFSHEFPELCKGNIPQHRRMHKMPQEYWIPDMQYVEDTIEFKELPKEVFEKYEGAIFVDFVPTSENIAGWLLEICQEKMKGLEGVEVVAVEYWETPKSHCRVEAEDEYRATVIG